MKNKEKPNKNNSATSDISNIKPKSTLESIRSHNTINTFKEALNNNVDEFFKHKQTLPCNNISQHEKNVISEFSKWQDLVFTKVEKGGATVILDVDDYLEKEKN